MPRRLIEHRAWPCSRMASQRTRLGYWLVDAIVTDIEHHGALSRVLRRLDQPADQPQARLRLDLKFFDMERVAPSCDDSVAARSGLRSAGRASSLASFSLI